MTDVFTWFSEPLEFEFMQRALLVAVVLATSVSYLPGLSTDRITLDESVIDDHIVRILRLADRVGSLGTDRSHQTDLPAPDSAVRREQLTRLAASGMTVLTNNGVLPLEPWVST